MRVLLVASFALLLIAPAAVAAPRDDPDAFTPIVPTVLARPWPVQGSDGRYHFVYEVQLVNGTPLPWRVTGIAVRSGGRSRRTLASWRGKHVPNVLRSLANNNDIRRIGPGTAALLYVTFTVRKRSAIPATLVHAIQLANPNPANGAPKTVDELVGHSEVIRRPPVVLGPPLAGDRWVAADGCCTARRHVRATQPVGGGLFTAQRFAIDWERLYPDGRLFHGDKKVLTNWAGYEQPIRAVADGTVVRAVDHLPDQVPGALPQGIDPALADGNAVFLRLANGEVVFYAHMVPGSVAVHRGQRVVRGQLLGRVGNSGNSSAPHLHLHVVDRNAAFAANGLPYVFSSFDITGKVASTEAFNHGEETGEPLRLGPVRKGVRRRELSLDQVIVTWPG
jgi:Peptidase family M23